MKDILEKALDEQDYLMHHGILGQKWGVRRYQHKDGSLTEEGRKHYGVSSYQNEDWSLTEAGRKKYLKEGSNERKSSIKLLKNMLKLANNMVIYGINFMNEATIKNDIEFLES